MAEPQLYMWSGVRELLLSRHDFYVEQVKKRVLGNFENMEEEANSVANEVYEHLGSSPYYGDGDMSSAAETAFESGLEFFEMLLDMRTQTILGAVAALYHQWEKDLRGFLVKELSHTYNRDDVKRYCWSKNLSELFDLLKEFGWDVRSQNWFSLVEACRLIVNVYKHGSGPSLDKLTGVFPQYLKGPFDSIEEAGWLASSDHENLSVTVEEFDEIAGALRSFWEQFPERLYSASS